MLARLGLDIDGATFAAVFAAMWASPEMHRGFFRHEGHQDQEGHEEEPGPYSWRRKRGDWSRDRR